jgi:hypothetical protein
MVAHVDQVETELVGQGGVLEQLTWRVLLGPSLPSEFDHLDPTPNSLRCASSPLADGALRAALTERTLCPEISRTRFAASLCYLPQLH